MASYKLPLIKAYPEEMKYLILWAYKLGGKLSVDNPEFVGLQKEHMVQGLNQLGDSVLTPTLLNVSFNDQDPQAMPPDGILSLNGFVLISTEDNVDSKKNAILQLYQWAQKLENNLYSKIIFFDGDLAFLTQSS